MLLALEDLHWADPATHALVMSLLRMSRRLPLCLVVTYEPEALHRRHPAMPFAAVAGVDRRRRVASRSRPSADETAALVEAQLGEAPSSSQLAALVEGSDGIPLLSSSWRW